MPMEISVGQLTWDRWINATACVLHAALGWVSKYVTNLNTQKKKAIIPGEGEYSLIRG